MHNLAVAEATEFSNNFYIRVKETSTGVNAFKILVSRNGGISPEPGPNMMWKRQVQSYGEHDGQVVCAERAKLRVASAGESKGAILSRPKKNALGTFRRAAQKTVVFERVHLRPSGAYKSVTYRLRRPEVFERPARWIVLQSSPKRAQFDL